MPGRPPLTRTLLTRGPRRVVGVLALLVLPACTAADEPPPRATGPVAVPAPSEPPTPSVLQACERLLAALPDEVDPGVERRPVEGDPARTAAWGDPPVVLRCGVAAPDRLDEPASVNGVVWSVRDIGAGYSWTTTELPVTVVVEVPDAYANPAELVNPLAEPLLSTLGPARSPAG